MMNRIEINVQTGEQKVVALTQAEIDALSPLPTQAEIEARERQQYIDSVVDALQSVMDKEAQSMGYDNIVTAITYAGEPSVAQFQLEGQSCRAWRSNVWEYAYVSLGQYEADLLAYPSLLAQYDLDKAQYDLDILAEPPLDPAPVLPVIPIEPIQPTLNDIIINIPARV